MKGAHALPLAALLRKAVALRQAVLDGDLAEARHRVRSIETLAAIYDLDGVRGAAHALEADMGSWAPEPQLTTTLEMTGFMGLASTEAGDTVNRCSVSLLKTDDGLKSDRLLIRTGRCEHGPLASLGYE